jgi:hypothetical protein
LVAVVAGAETEVSEISTKEVAAVRPVLTPTLGVDVNTFATPGQ